VNLDDIEIPTFEIDLTPQPEPTRESREALTGKEGVVTIVEATRALDATDRVRARLKPELIERWKKTGTMDEYTYGSYRICHSKLTGKWWVMTEDGVFMGYAEDYIGGRMMIDQAIARGK